MSQDREQGDKEPPKGIMPHKSSQIAVKATRTMTIPMEDSSTPEPSCEEFSGWTFVSSNIPDLEQEEPDDFVVVIRPREQPNIANHEAHDESHAPDPCPGPHSHRHENPDPEVHEEFVDYRVLRTFPEVHRAICDNFPSYVEHKKASARAPARRLIQNWNLAPVKLWEKTYEHSKVAMALGAEELLEVFRRLLERHDLTAMKVKAIKRSRDVVMSFKHLGFILDRPDKKLYLRWIHDVGEAILRHQEFSQRIRTTTSCGLEEPEVFEPHSMALWSKQWAIILGRRDLAADTSVEIKNADGANALFRPAASSNLFDGWLIPPRHTGTAGRGRARGGSKRRSRGGPAPPGSGR